MTEPRANASETISAIATPLGEGGIGVIRMSGPQALAIADLIFVSRHQKSVGAQKNFTARHGQVMTPENGQKKAVDEALLLVMRAPKSYTGEDVVEIQAHGGPAVLRVILDLTLKHGARLARPGEFTERAFLNGRMDLVQAEAVLDLIQARTERSVRWAASQLEGDLSKKIAVIKEKLLEIRAHLEAQIDFPEDSPETKSVTQTEEALASVEGLLRHLLSGSELGLFSKRGLKVVLWGRPNVGKSSLLNRLTRSDRVMVTAIPGTTRDVVEEEVLIDGFVVRLQDTAGIQDTDHPIKKESMDRSRKAMLQADLILFILDRSRALEPEDKRLWQELVGRPVVVVLNKSDLPQQLDDAEAKGLFGSFVLAPCSCMRDDGDRSVRQAITGFMTRGLSDIPEEALITSARQKQLLEKTLARVAGAREACSGGLSHEFICSDVRLALKDLGELSGEVVTDDVLEVLFSKFCIGK